MSYIEDKFNLTGLPEFVPDYKNALQLILDDEQSEDMGEEEVRHVEQAAEMVFILRSSSSFSNASSTASSMRGTS